MQTQYAQTKLTVKQKESAMLHNKQAFPDKCPCIVCGYAWMQHKGLLCPHPLSFGGSMLFPYYAPGDTLFIPDEKYYKAPDFEVV